MIAIIFQMPIYREPDKKLNVHDFYKSHDNEVIKKIAVGLTNPYAIMIYNCHGDFNTATLARTGSCMGAATIYTVGRRKFDRRPLVGSHNYTVLNRLDDLDPDPVTWFDVHGMYPVFIEQDGDDLDKFDFRSLWNKPKIPCLVVGSECDGIPESFISMFPGSPRLSIVQPGVIRSLNVCNAGAMVMDRLYYSYKSHIMDKYGLD
jgi:tRNA G18 (ribose-2'-O)-methylase SpoU